MWVVASRLPGPREPEWTTSHTWPSRPCDSSRKWLPRPRVPIWPAASPVRDLSDGTGFSSSQLSARSRVGARLRRCLSKLITGTALENSASTGPRSSGRRSAVMSRRSPEMPQPMSTPTAEGMIVPSVTTTDPMQAPMPTWASGMMATGGTTPRARAVWRACSSAPDSTPSAAHDRTESLMP